jgi:chromosome segregation ATPase
MKHVLAVFALLFCGCLAFASTADDINQIQNQINTDVAKRADMVTRSNAQDKKADDIKFVWNAYTKAKTQYDSDVTNFNNKSNEVKRGFELLEPSIENYKERVNAHNARQCVEQCTNGSCDGSCGWYTAEKNQLDNNLQQLKQAEAPLDAAANQLQSDKSYLDQTYEKLNTIYQGVQSGIAQWKADELALKAEWEANEAEIAKLQAMLAQLQGENMDCFAKIPPACQNPEIGPDGKPILDQNCERMHAACGRMFDGNR